jgi:hypothetical protein
MTLQCNIITFHTETKEFMRITADSVTVAPGVSVDEAASAVLVALEQHIWNIVAAEREACAKLVGEFAQKWWSIHCASTATIAHDGKTHDDFCALQAVIRARGEK